MNNIHLQNEDYGNQYLIQVANSAGLKIVQSGTSTLSSLSKSFVLQSNFACPRYSKNPLYVQRFCLDNNVFFEFHVSFFFVKDYLGNILHRGPLSNGLYNFSTFLARLYPQNLSSVRVSTNIWHRHLGHASLPVLNKVILLPVQNKNTSICSKF